MKDVLLMNKGLRRLLLDEKGVNPVNLKIVDIIRSLACGDLAMSQCCSCLNMTVALSIRVGTHESACSVRSDHQR